MELFLFTNNNNCQTKFYTRISQEENDTTKFIISTNMLKPQINIYYKSIDWRRHNVWDDTWKPTMILVMLQCTSKLTYLLFSTTFPAGYVPNNLSHRDEVIPKPKFWILK